MFVAEPSRYYGGKGVCGKVISGPADRLLAARGPVLGAVAGLAALDDLKGRKLALLIGPEGGFDEADRAALRAHAGSFSLSLGPRILRTDTAVVAALALLQSRIGDWPDTHQDTP